jgi:hypothetical protein
VIKPISIASSKIYHLTIGSDDFDEPCGNSRCELVAEFVWRGRDHCHSTLLCTVLDGNICGDYGMVAGNVTVCHEGVDYEDSLESGQMYDVRAWYAAAWPDSHRGAECYFWCTSDGGAPPAPGAKIDSALINSLVNILFVD